MLLRSVFQPPAANKVSAMNGFAAWAAVALALFSALFIAGCIQVQGNVNASVVDLGRISVSVNKSFSQPNLTVNGFGESVAQGFVPDNASVCFYGERVDFIKDDFFGQVGVFGKQVALLPKWLDEGTPPSAFYNCTVIVFTDDVPAQFPSTAQRQAVGRQVTRGAGLIVMGLGAARASDDSSVFGWDGGLAGTVPVRPYSPGSKEATPLGFVTLNGVLFASEPDPAFDGAALPRKVEGMHVTVVLPAADGSVIAFVKEGFDNSPTAPSYFAIARACPLGRNCAYYFGYDATAYSPDVLRNAVRFLAGEALGKYLALRALPAS